MTAEETLLAALDLSATLVGLIGDRRFPLSLPQSTVLPALTYTRVSTLTDSTLEGDSGEGWVRMQIEILHTDFAEARAIRHAVRLALHDDATPQGFHDLSDPDRGLVRLVDDYLIYEEVF